MAVPVVVTGADVFAFVGAGGTYDDTPANGTPSAWALIVAAAVNQGIASAIGRGDDYDDDIGTDAMAEVRAAAHVAGNDLWTRREAPFGLAGYSDTDAGVRVARDWITGIAPVLERYRDVSQGIG